MKGSFRSEAHRESHGSIHQQISLLGAGRSLCQRRQFQSVVEEEELEASDKEF